MLSLLTLLLPLSLGLGPQAGAQPRMESLLARPLYLAESPPPLRALNNIVLLHSGVSQEMIKHNSARTPLEAQALAMELVKRLRAGESFAEIASAHSSSANARFGGTLGAYPRGMLLPQLDEFLWTAELGQISDPLETPIGIQILKRDHARAGVLHIRVSGEDAELKATQLHERLLAGESFAELAKAHSADAASAAAGGQYAIFVRGSQDTQLKALTFGLKVGELSKPYETPLGWHIIKRVPPSELPPELEERTFVRARAILVAWKGCVAASEEVTRDKARALEVVRNIEERIQAGDSMAEYAASRFNDDPGGRARAGDLGWLYRRNPDMPVFMSEAFRVAPNTLLDLKETSAGFVLLRREEG